MSFGHPSNNVDLLERCDQNLEYQVNVIDDGEPVAGRHNVI